jgi:hypothetical protein
MYIDMCMYMLDKTHLTYPGRYRPLCDGDDRWPLPTVMWLCDGRPEYVMGVYLTVTDRYVMQPRHACPRRRPAPRPDAGMYIYIYVYV